MDWADIAFGAKTTEDGQPGISVRDHCLNVGCVAEALIAAMPASMRQGLPPGETTLAALHLMGKITVGGGSESVRRPWPITGSDSLPPDARVGNLLEWQE